MKEMIKKILIIIIFIILCILVTKKIFKPEENQLPEEQNTEAKTPIEITMDKYYNNIFDKHSSKYCGQLNYDDTFENYINTLSYGNIKDLTDNYKTFLSEKYIEENLIKNFIEKDEKLYCQAKQMSSLIYKKDSFKITNQEETKTEIKLEGTYETEADDLNPKETFNVKVTLIQQSDTWVIDSYQETYMES